MENKRNEFAEFLGKIVIHVRKERGLTQPEFATQIGITQSALSRLERGLITPDALVFRRLAQVIGKTPDKLYSIIDKAIKHWKPIMNALQQGRVENG